MRTYRRQSASKTEVFTDASKQKGSRIIFLKFKRRRKKRERDQIWLTNSKMFTTTSIKLDSFHLYLICLTRHKVRKLFYIQMTYGFEF
jgi:hypothetical protein